MKQLFYLITIFILISCVNNTSNKTTHSTAQKKVFKGNAFGTTYSINVYLDEDIKLEKGIDSLIYLVNRSVSIYLPNSDISKINKGDASIVVDQIFIDNFNISKEVNLKTQGYFDPTIGVLRNAYGFGDEKPLEKIDRKTIDSLLQYVGFQKVSINAENKVEKEYPQIYFDFNAVAKGYGIDRIGQYLESKGISNYLIELGGELLAKGINLEKDKDWVVGIENVDSKLENRSYSTILTLKNEAMAASGNYRKFRIDPISGKKYVHTLNPITGSAEKSDVTSATVIASTCAVADAYATSFMALGLERSKEVLANLKGVDAYLTYNDESNTERVYVTEGFKTRLLN